MVYGVFQTTPLSVTTVGLGKWLLEEVHELIPNCVSVGFQSLESSRFKIKPCVTVGFDCYLPEDMCSMYLLKLPVGVTRVECRGTSDLN